jgi:hypothetical protein
MVTTACRMVYGRRNPECVYPESSSKRNELPRLKTQKPGQLVVFRLCTKQQPTFPYYPRFSLSRCYTSIGPSLSMGSADLILGLESHENTRLVRLLLSHRFRELPPPVLEYDESCVIFTLNARNSLSQIDGNLRVCCRNRDGTQRILG